ncbi:DUF4412 domain-containing protein [uncultured Cyclobacterium sp.]|uniref:DUF4412 domain-containing protein n=1 Tax=uncultured Cyclobacterium sp. TaxID=453820 RepID=UPI0030ED2FFA
MKVKSLFLLVIALSFLSLDAECQLLRKLKRAASEGVSQGVSRAVEKTVAKQMEKATERQLEKAFENLYGDYDSGNIDGDSTNQQGKSYDISKIMGSINMNVDTESEYNFSGVAVMEIKSTSKKGKEEDPVLFNSFLSENPDYFGMEFIDPDRKDANEKSIIIMDHKNKATVMLMENEEEKSSMAFGMDWSGMLDTYADTAAHQPYESMTFEKTGNKKDIHGYSCEEFRMASEDGEGTYWISEESVEGLEGFWSKNSPFVTKKMKEQNSTFFGNFPEGNIMEMTFKSKEDESSSEMKIIKIDNSQSTSYKLADYPNPMKAAN